MFVESEPIELFSSLELFAYVAAEWTAWGIYAKAISDRHMSIGKFVKLAEGFDIKEIELWTGVGNATETVWSRVKRSVLPRTSVCFWNQHNWNVVRLLLWSTNTIESSYSLHFLTLQKNDYYFFFTWPAVQHKKMFNGDRKTIFRPNTFQWQTQLHGKLFQGWKAQGCRQKRLLMSNSTIGAKIYPILCEIISRNKKTVENLNGLVHETVMKSTQFPMSSL